jgi:S-adenosylmethionine synthetase
VLDACLAADPKSKVAYKTTTTENMVTVASKAVLDACLAADPKSKVAYKTTTTDNMVMVASVCCA